MLRAVDLIGESVDMAAKKRAGAAAAKAAVAAAPATKDEDALDSDSDVGPAAGLVERPVDADDSDAAPSLEGEESEEELPEEPPDDDLPNEEGGRCSSCLAKRSEVRLACLQ